MVNEERKRRQKNFPPERWAAIRKSIHLGRMLIEEHPEIADLWRQGFSRPEIIRRLNIKQDYDVSEYIARGGVCRAIYGHEGGFDTESYEGLLPDAEERKRIFDEHHRETGIKILKQKVGLYGRTPDQHSKDSHRGGSKGGRRAYELKVGVHARTPEQLSKDNTKASHMALISRGYILWSDEEKEEAYRLSQQPEYIWQESTRPGTPNYRKIAERLNEIYHGGKPVRNSATVVARNSLTIRAKNLEHRESLEKRMS